MKLTILGTGTWQPHDGNASAGYVVETAQTALKLDFGRGNLMRMAEAGIDWKALDAILVSHRHPDHIADMMQYFQAYGLEHDGGFSDNDTIKQIELLGPSGFTSFFQQFRMVVDTRWAHIPEVQEMFEQTVQIGDATITATEVEHSAPSVGYRIESEGKSLVYTGDTGYTENLLQLAEDATVMLTECYWANGQEGEGHLTPRQIAEIANEARVRTVVLTHYPAGEEERQLRKDQVKEDFKGRVIAAEDLQVIEI